MLRVWCWVNFKRCLCDKNVDCVSLLYFVKLKDRTLERKKVLENLERKGRWKVNCILFVATELFLKYVRTCEGVC